MKPAIKFFTKEFNKLSIEELYSLLKLRSDIFVVEQDCVYLDIDGKDQEAIHIIGKIDGQIIAYARGFPKDFYFKNAVALGRVIVKEGFRKQGFAHKLIEYSIGSLINSYGNGVIKISAQQHLEKFYKQHGFKRIGEGYLEDGIPHYSMVRD